MKKIALALVAVSALGLAGCGDRDAHTNNAVDTNTEAAINEANADLENAQDAADNALDAAGSALDNAGERSRMRPTLRKRPSRTSPTKLLSRWIARGRAPRRAALFLRLEERGAARSCLMLRTSRARLSARRVVPCERT